MRFPRIIKIIILFRGKMFSMRTIALSLMASVSVFAGICEEVNLKEHFPAMPENVQIASKQERFGLCEYVVRSGRGGFFTIYAGKDFAIAGAMVSKGIHLSQESILKAQSEEIRRILPELAKLGIKEGSGEKVLYMISDPECPYCEGIKKKAYELAKERRWAISLVWFPIKPSSQNKVVSFVCEKRGWKDYLAGSYGTSKCEKGIQYITKSREVLEEIVSGTPTFILSTGKVIGGANLRALEEELR